MSRHKDRYVYINEIKIFLKNTFTFLDVKILTSYEIYIKIVMKRHIQRPN